ncbi:MAG: hypothetical protein JWQ22_1477 [Devosia sp.]|nr:hypothetical protein [Devosia sp.]
MAKLTAELLKTIMPEPGKRVELLDDVESGLMFRVTETGKRSWSIRYRNAVGEQRRKSIGPFPDIGLQGARDQARKIKGAVAGGIDVVGTERAAKADAEQKKLRTFRGLAEAYFADAELGLHKPNAKKKRPSTIKLDKGMYDRHVEPHFGDWSISDMRRADIQTFITKLSKKVASNGRHSRNLIRQVLAYGVWKGLLEFNAALAIAVINPEPRDRVLTDDEIKAIWHALIVPASVDGLKLSKVMGLALRMAMVTLQRGGEVIGMRWDEVDRARRTWIIPASRMKGKRAHVVPLSDLAIELLAEAEGLIKGNGGEYVFESRVGEGEQMDRQALTRAMGRLVKAIKIPRATAHDFRRTGATNLTSERGGVSRFIVSMVIAHAGDTGGAAAVTGRHYDMNDYLADKRRALEAWTTLLQAIVKA